jgi:hypothetical protein
MTLEELSVYIQTVPMELYFDPKEMGTLAKLLEYAQEQMDAYYATQVAIAVGNARNDFENFKSEVNMMKAATIAHIIRLGVFAASIAKVEKPRSEEPLKKSDNEDQ